MCWPQYTRFIYGYMCFAGFSIFFVMAGIISLQLLEAWHVAMVSSIRPGPCLWIVKAVPVDLLGTMFS